MTRCAGWNLHLDRCEQFDDGGKAVFSINIVMPYCREGGNDVRTTTADALAAYPQFLFPHMWRGAAYRLYWNDGADSAALATRSDWQLDPAGAAAAAAAVTDAVKARCRQSADTFSIADEAFSPSADGASLAHALAHLTHWPAGLSDSVLSRSWYLELNAADAARIPANAQVAVFPSFDFDDGAGARIEFKPAGFVKADKPPRWLCGDDLYQLTCPLQAFVPPTVKHADAPAAVALTQSRLSTFDLRALVASHFHPLLLASRGLAPFLAVLRKAAAGRLGGLDKIVVKIEHGDALDAGELKALREAFDQPALAAPADLASIAAWARRLGLAGAVADVSACKAILCKALVQLPGCGWDRLHVGNRLAVMEPHLFEMLPDWQALRRAAGALAIPAKILFDNDRVTNSKAAALLAATFEQDRVTTEDLKRLFGDGNDAPSIFESWLRLAGMAAEGSSGHTFTQRWLQRIDACFFADADQAKRWQPIHDGVARLIGAGVNTRSWYERNAQGTLDRLGATASPLQRLAFWDDVMALAGEAAKAEQHDPGTLATLQATVTAALCARLEAELGAALPPLFIASQVDAFAKAILQRSSWTTSVQHEPGLGMVFDTGSGAADSDIRGYAIALRAGVPTGAASAQWDDERAQWITDTALNLKSADKALLMQGDGAVAWMHEAYGSTLSNGQRVVAAEYLGSPLMSVPYREVLAGGATIEPAVGKDRDFDDFASIEFLWPEWLPPANRTDLPLLGYGLSYQALATPIGNAGGILASCRIDGTISRLKPARDVFGANGAMVNFRSRQKIDAPDVRLLNAATHANPQSRKRSVLVEEADAYALSSQTRAAAWLSASGITTRSGKQPMIALLTDDSDIWDLPYRARSYTLLMRPPRPSAAFVERWLNADVLSATLNTGAFTHPAFAAAAPQKIAAFRDMAVARLQQGAAQGGQADSLPNREYHPAVAAIGVAIVFGGATGAPQRYAHPVNPIRDDGAAYAIDHDASTVALTVRAARAGETSHYDQGAAALVLEHGQFARVSVYSLVDRKWIDGTPRFHALAEFSEFAPDTPAAIRYQCCEGSEFIFEMAPAPPGDLGLTDGLFVMQAPTPARAASLTLTMQSRTGIPADWLHGVHYTPFDFHWTGYPLDFPPADGSSTADWLPAHANASTERPDLQGDVVLDTSFGANPGEWFVGKRAGPAAPWIAGIADRPLRSTTRPATQAAYTVRMQVRFRAWLRRPVADEPSPLHIESASLAASAFIRGIAPDLLSQRLAVPALRMAVPLTSTYWPGAGSADGATPQRQQSGNMLVFDEAIRRTDDMAAVGGVGETLEIDLLAARGFDGMSLDKVGPNPVFHAPPAAPDIDRTRQVAPLAPFGLTYDQSDNGLVVQTGIIVVPEGGAGEWLLAEVRTRRMILPEVLMGTELSPAAKADDPAGTACFSIPLRLEGDDYVPLDFCIDVRSGRHLDALGLFKRGAQAPQAIALKAAPADGYRLLVSWHKARYEGADKPTWRMQVLTQVRIPGQLEWRRVGKLTCEDTNAFDWLQTNGNGLLLLADAPGVIANVSIVPMSDYTPGLWLHFIGNFASTPIGPGDFTFRRGAANALTLTARPGRAPTAPECIALSVAENDAAVEFHWLLVYRPLRDVTRSGIDSDAGVLLGAWRYAAGTSDFHPLDGDNQTIDLAGCYAYLCTFHRSTALSVAERSAIETIETAGGTKALIECMFPDQEGKITEATIRMVPKVLGQIAIVQGGS